MNAEKGKVTNYFLFIVVLALAIIGLSLQPLFAEVKTSRPFEYFEYSYPEYENYTTSSQFIMAEDGVQLAVQIYLPADGPSNGPYPVIFTYLPYHRAHIDPATGEMITNFDQDAVDFFTSYGYAMVLAGMRGSGASFGSRLDMSPPLAEDGKLIIDWISTQSWCDGKIGMIGGSYHGWSQFATAGQKPQALKCIIPELIYFDAYSSAIHYPGGIYNKGLSDTLGAVFPIRDLNFSIPPANVFPALPVIDEDGDGELLDEIPLDLNASGSFLDEGYSFPDNPPQYSDNNIREHIYYMATLEHLGNAPINGWSKDARYRDSSIPGGFTYSDLGPANFPRGLIESGIPVYNFGGWFDAFTRSTTLWHSTLSPTNPSKMLVGPINHSSPGTLSGRYPGPYIDYFGINLDALSSGYLFERLRFLDRYLKGINNGVDQEPPIYLYVMNGAGWRAENEWPIKRRVLVDYFLEEGNSLKTVQKTEGTDDYPVDFTHDSRELSSGGNRWNLGILDEVADRTEKDLKCLTYTSQTLKQDTEITGHPVVHLWVSSTVDYGDFFVYLEDVDETGKAYLVTDGQLRAGFAKLLPNEDIIGNEAAIDVLPDLPWHGYRLEDYEDRIFSGGNVVELVIDLMPTSWVFRKGHRFRVSIASADWPTFRLNPELCPSNLPGECSEAPTVTVYRDPDHLSRIELPVIPSKPRIFKGHARIRKANMFYRGPAYLYTFQDNVYLQFKDKWLKWDTVKYREAHKLEIFKCKGHFGTMIASVHQRKNGTFSAKAVGKKVWFSGKAQ